MEVIIFIIKGVLHANALHNNGVLYILSIISSLFFSLLLLMP